MLINGKAEHITKEDFRKVAQKVGIKASEAEKCMQQVKSAVMKWEQFAKEAGVSEFNARRICDFFGL